MIRKANKCDIEQINDLGNKLHNNFNTTYHIETEIESNLAIVLVAEENSCIVGYLYALEYEDNADLLSIYVDEFNRLSNIGHELISTLQKICKEKSIILEVSDKNVGAIALYYKCNFKKIGIRKNYYKDSDAIVMKWGI